MRQAENAYLVIRQNEPYSKDWTKIPDVDPALPFNSNFSALGLRVTDLDLEGA